MAEENADKEIDIASNNKLGSDNTVKISLFNIENDFTGLANAVSCFFPSIRYEMLLRYRAETIAKIGIEAYRIAQNENVHTNPIPPKIALPLIEKMSLEHEPDMYEKWAKLLVATSVNPNPIHQQYADILSNLNNYSANILKDIYLKQTEYNMEKKLDDYIDKSRFQRLYRDIENKSREENFVEYSQSLLSTFIGTYAPFHFPLNLYGTEKNKASGKTFLTLYENNVKKTEDCLALTERENTMLMGLEKLGLVKYQSLIPKPSNDEDGNIMYIEVCGVLLTRFGYSLTDCLENPSK